jgi:hypothetical protein
VDLVHLLPKYSIEIQTVTPLPVLIDNDPETPVAIFVQNFSTADFLSAIFPVT